MKTEQTVAELQETVEATSETPFLRVYLEDPRCR